MRSVTYCLVVSCLVLQMLRARQFCIHHEYIFALLCLLNVNMGALDLSQPSNVAEEYTSVDGYNARGLLYDLAQIYSLMDKEKQARVYKRVMSSGALPVSRDTPSYAAVVSVLLGGAAGQLEYGAGASASAVSLSSQPKEEDEEEAVWDGRAEAKRAHADRMAALKFVRILTLFCHFLNDSRLGYYMILYAMLDIFVMCTLHQVNTVPMFTVFVVEVVEVVVLPCRCDIISMYRLKNTLDSLQPRPSKLSLLRNQ